MYTVLRNGLHHLYIPGRLELVTTKKGLFEETYFPLPKNVQENEVVLFDYENQ